jgi:hypothetical protein
MRQARYSSPIGLGRCSVSEAMARQSAGRPPLGYRERFQNAGCSEYGRTRAACAGFRGYHGTSATQAAVIVRDGFPQSDNDYDCLGNGVYFFEDGLAPARAWAKRAHPSEPAVVQADVRLEDCMDLKDTLGWVPLLA